MSNKYWIVRFLIVVLCLMTFGCIAQKSVEPKLKDQRFFDPMQKTFHSIKDNECSPVDVAGQVKKVDNFMVIFDPSASMTEPYYPISDCATCHKPHGNEKPKDSTIIAIDKREQVAEKIDPRRKCQDCHNDYSYAKFNFAKSITNCFNETIPDLSLIGALRSFGSPVYSMINYGPKKYSREEYSNSLRRISEAGGVSSLEHALTETKKDFFTKQGKIAVIVISDGKNMGKKPVFAVDDLKTTYGDNICVYTIFIGNDRQGEKLLDEIARAGQCGGAISAEKLISSQGMNNFVSDIFLKPGLKMSAVEASSIVQEKKSIILDGDGDEVLDDKDDCPDTPPGLEVDKNGCWHIIVPADIFFDFDKYDIKPKGLEILDKVVEMLNKYSFLKLHIGGHTDNFGSMEYNIVLSRKRVEAGFNYLKEKGFDKNRISISWHSFSLPRTSNETKEGRALNRRIEFVFSKETAPSDQELSGE